MAAAPDPDSQMLSSPSDSDIDTTTTTPLAQQAAPSPPDSQHRSMPTAASGANANGKRPLNTISNGLEDGGEDGTKPRREFPTKTHAASGYTWDRAEDEPGFAWLSKKAGDEYKRAFNAMVHQDCLVLGTSAPRVNPKVCSLEEHVG